MRFKKKIKSPLGVWSKFHFVPYILSFPSLKWYHAIHPEPWFNVLVLVSSPDQWFSITTNLRPLLSTHGQTQSNLPELYVFHFSGVRKILKFSPFILASARRAVVVPNTLDKDCKVYNTVWIYPIIVIPGNDLVYVII